MFEQLSEKLLGSLKKLQGQARITEKNIQEAIKEIRLGLLEADVNFKVVKVFIDRVKEKALNVEVLENLTVGQQFTQLVHDELVEVLGSEATEVDFRGNPGVIFMVGLQGAGKTTTAAKLALHLRKKFKKKPGLIPVDVYRPAAIEQLQTLAKTNDLPCFPSSSSESPQKLLEQAKQWAKENMIDVVIVDTAGRLQIDDELMSELSDLKEIWKPNEILLVADAMLGQQSVNVAEGFREKLGLTGLVLTKVDGDARGGAALSIREATGIPIKFLGVGEKVGALEVFHPDRLASRILDRGDVLTLVERAKEVVDEKKARESARKMAKNKFTLEDFLDQIQTMKKLGGIESILGIMPGMGQAMKQMKKMAPPDKEIKKIEAIIGSMTPSERQNHRLLNGSRRKRIALGSGTEVSDVNKFIRQFEESQKMLSKMMKMGFKKGGFPGFGGGQGLPF